MINITFALVAMNSSESIKTTAQETLQIEIDNLQYLLADLDQGIVDAVQCILESNARVVISGIGKSAIIAQKIVATLNSTGTPALFMHAADALHGDLGMVQTNDVVVVISNSGNTPEIKALVPLIKKFGNKLIGFTGNKESFLGKNSDIVVGCKIAQEACPNNLAPTSSTTAQMVMGDALAVCLIKCRNFSSSDFSKYHPGGNLGKRMYTTVQDLCDLHQKAQVKLTDSFSAVLNEITSKRLGATAVIQGSDLMGVITDGDIRRALQQEANIYELKAKDIMTENPLTIKNDVLAVHCIEKFKTHNISQLLVVDEQGNYCGIIHIHDLNREGIL